jgi:hypothetical protein
LVLPGNKTTIFPKPIGPLLILCSLIYQPRNFKYFLLE